MLYKDFKGLKLSALGLGTMRLPVCDGDNGRIDKAAASQMLAYAMEQGINYYDTAWRYHDGTSESVMGELLQAYPRDSFYLATKFPASAKTLEDMPGLFEKQLEKCRTEYFDFYLFHNVCERNIQFYLDPQYGILDYFLQQKKAGRIRHLGFSTHGSLETIEKFLQVYGRHLEFCQIQLNWLDWHLQYAKEKVDLLRKWNLPIWVMEPVRGGKLVNLAEKHEKRLRALKPDTSVVEWAFRFLQTVPDVTVTLSGMSNMTQLQENIRTYQTQQPLNQEEWDTILDVAQTMTKENALPCTACRYCTEHCPKQLDIPNLIEMYNECKYTRVILGAGLVGAIGPMMVNAMPAEKRPSACIGCRACEAACPQNIKISEAMAHFTEILAKK